jgi:hypothetical protein
MREVICQAGLAALLNVGLSQGFGVYPALSMQAA